MNFGETGNRSEPVRLVRPEGGLHRQSLPSPANLRPPPATRACAVFLMQRLDPWPAATPVPARCLLSIEQRGCSQHDTASGTSWHGYGLLTRHRAPWPLLTSWPSPHMGQKCSLQNGRAIAAPIPRHQTYCSPGVLVLLRSQRPSIFTPCPSRALGMLAGERKRPYSLGRGSSISKPRTSSQLCRRCFTRQCLSFPICKMRVTITTYLRGRAVQVGERPALQNPPHQQTTQPGTGGTEGTASSPPLTASLILLRRKMLARALLPATAQMSSQLHPHRTTLRLFDKDEYCFLNKYKNSASSLASSF